MPNFLSELSHDTYFDISLITHQTLEGKLKSARHLRSILKYACVGVGGWVERCQVIKPKQHTQKFSLMSFYCLKVYIRKEEVKHCQNLCVLCLWKVSYISFLTSSSHQTKVSKMWF